MFCTKCGAELPDDAVFCSRCGVKIVIPERVSGTVERTQTAPGREAAVVYDEEEFRTAVTERRETIIIRGEIAGKLARRLGTAPRGTGCPMWRSLRDSSSSGRRWSGGLRASSSRGS